MRPAALCILLMLVDFHNALPQKGLKELVTTSPSKLIMSGEDYRRDRCYKKKFRETLFIDGCNPVFFENNYCYGGCNSIYLPSYKKSSYKYCTACIPSKFTKRKIIFKCVKNGVEHEQEKTVTVIEDCKCKNVSCTKKK